jgi:predicted RNase H-like HicB family nuclease
VFRVGGEMDIQKLKVTIELWQKEKWIIARIPELDIVAQGETIEKAKENLMEVVRIQFAEMREMGTFEDYLAECGFVVRDNVVEQYSDIIGFEKQVLQVA